THAAYSSSVAVLIPHLASPSLPSFSFYCYGAHRDLHSFPTRRSSDLKCGKPLDNLLPEGTGYRARTRFSKFFNLPELMNLFKERSEEHTSELQSRFDLVCRLLLEKKKKNNKAIR